MATNYTPIDIQKFRNDRNNTNNTLLLLIATFTTFVLVILLFILIQKKIKMQTPPQNNIIISPTLTPTNTPVSTITPLPTLELSPQASPSGITEITPTKEATDSLKTVQ